MRLSRRSRHEPAGRCRASSNESFRIRSRSCASQFRNAYAGAPVAELDRMDQATGRRAETRYLAPWLAATLIAVMFVGTTLVTPLYDVYRKEFGFSEMTLTLVYAVYAVGNLLSLGFFGRIS